MAFSSILGHERALRVLRRALASDRVPHAYLFWGPEGVGKEAVAKAAAQVLLCAGAEQVEPGTACGVCAACRKVEAGSHPDLHLVVPEGASIPIAAVRRLQETLSYQAFERGRKVAIIRDSSRMTREAANALLKTLEEPPAGTHLVLLAHHRNQLLPTLVSRCQSLRFDPIAEDLVARLLESDGVAPEVAETMAGVSGGCPGLVRGQAPEIFASVEREAAEAWECWCSGGAVERLGLAARWAADKAGLALRLDALERFLERRVREGALNGRAQEDTLRGLSAVLRVRELVEQNVNAELALDALLLGALATPWEESL
jgi:DNA polymerase-3 subunit delta'